MPAPVPPVTIRLAPEEIRSSSSASTGAPANISRATSATTKRRMVTYGPSTATGGATTWTREPSPSRPSTQGERWSTRRPSGPTIRSISRSTAVRSRLRPLRASVPSRSIQTGPGPLIITSLTEGSASRGSIGPSPSTLATTRSTASSTVSGRARGSTERTIPATTAGVRGIRPSASSTRRCAVSTSQSDAPGAAWPPRRAPVVSGGASTSPAAALIPAGRSAAAAWAGPRRWCRRQPCGPPGGPRRCGRPGWPPPRRPRRWSAGSGRAR